MVQPSSPRPWVIPAMVVGGVVVGCLSVPIALASGLFAAGATVTSQPMVSVTSTEAGATVVAVQPANTRSVQLASQPPAGPEPTRASSTGTGERSAALATTSGAPDSRITVTGTCRAGSDNGARAGVGGLGAGAATASIGSNGGFTIKLKAPHTTGDYPVTVACVTGEAANQTWHFSFHVDAASPTTSPGTTTTTSGTPTPTSTTPSSTPPETTGTTPTTTNSPATNSVQARTAAATGTPTGSPAAQTP